MGLLDNTTHQQYYQGNDLGNYQFTSLNHVIANFIVSNVGEDKLISKIKRADVAFHAQRALQELSFDTFRSIKTQQIDMPASLVMPLPHDYVNYTRIMWVDDSGIKHPIYPTRDTQNPFQIAQEDNGAYSFPKENEEVVDGDFASGDFSVGPWYAAGGTYSDPYTKARMTSGKLQFSHKNRSGLGASAWGYTSVIFQPLDVSDKDFVNLSASGLAVDTAGGKVGVLRVGLGSDIGGGPDWNNKNFLSSTSTFAANVRTTNWDTTMFDLTDSNGDPSYLEWTAAVDGTTSTDKELLGIDVRNVAADPYDGKKWVLVMIVSFHEFYDEAGGTIEALQATNNVDNVSVTNYYDVTMLQPDDGKNSSTWKNYKSGTPPENQDDYQDDVYWPAGGERYGLDPQHAQANGSFFIDQRLGRIHFSSNISGKTVVLDYISDSLGTDEEMQVHKFAEEAMYKWIAYSILSTRPNIPEYVVQRYKKEKFAETRKAKLRLSNIKLEEITQIFRGKSKQIKH